MHWREMINRKIIISVYIYALRQELRCSRSIKFDKTNLSTYVEELNPSINHNTLSKDFSVFLRTYHSKNGKDKEDSFSGFFSDLELVHEIKKKDASSKFSISSQ